MSVEVLDYRLEIRGVPAGRHLVRSKDEGQHVRMESEATFEGGMSAAKVVQLSRSDVRDHVSQEFRETMQDRSGERRFSVLFDAGEGLVKLVQGNDKAETPYIEAFRDPLSMLRELREAAPDTERVRIPMLGKTVEARALGEVEIDTPLGRRTTQSYQLFPGGSWLWIDVEPPHVIVRYRQRTGDGFVDGVLTRRSEETQLPLWDSHDQGSGGGRRRGKRRRRRRGGRSRSRRSGGS